MAPARGKYCRSLSLDKLEANAAVATEGASSKKGKETEDEHGAAAHGPTTSSELCDDAVA